MKPDEQEILRAVGALFAPGSVVELRVLDASTPTYRSPHVESGYFDDWAKLAQAVRSITRAKGIYVTINPVNPALLSRAVNRIRPAAKEPLTSDHDIVVRRYLPIDIDAERPAGISATDNERRATRVVAHAIRLDLTSKGWPAPIIADSGNGAHLDYRIDLPADDSGLVERCLKALAADYADYAMVKVDTTTHNPARIWKLYGTIAAKGDSTPERPHRRAKLLSVPETVAVVPLDKLEALAAVVKPAAPPNVPARNRDGGFDLDSWIAEHKLDVTGPEPWQGGRRWVFRVCPWEPSHTNRSAYIVQHASGAIGAGCHHNGCAGRDWHALRDLVEPGGRERRSARRTSAPSKSAPPEPPPYALFPTDALPAVVRDFIRQGAKALGCDESYIALPLLAALASAVGNARRIRLKRSWSEPCIVWAVAVGDSGTLKSPGFDLAMQPLRRLQSAAFKAHAEAMEVYARDKAIYEADLLEWKKKGRKNGDPPPEEPEEPVAVRYVAEDTTVEALAVLLQNQPRGLLLARDELSGWVNSFDAYKSCRGADVAHWLSMHRAEPMTVDRKTGRRMIYVPRASVSLAGNVQPKALAAALVGRYRADTDSEAQAKSNREHFDNGLAARLLFAMPPRRPKKWTEADLPKATEQAMEALFGRLLELDFVPDESGDPQPVDLPLAPDGKAAWVGFYNDHAREETELQGDLSAAWSKLEGYAARFALLVHLIRAATMDPTLTNTMLIDAESIKTGVAVARWFGEEAARVYAMIGGTVETAEAREQRELVRIIRDHGGEITARQLMLACRRYRSKAEEAEAALTRLVSDGIADIWVDDHGGKPGRPVSVFTLTDSGNGNTNGEIPEETAIVLPLPADNGARIAPDEDPGEVVEWTG